MRDCAIRASFTLLESGTNARQEFKSGGSFSPSFSQIFSVKNVNRTWRSDLKIRDQPEVNIRYNLGAPKFSIRLA